ncbi:MAG: WD40 repeat domain-containing protein, partial [Limisphaerales bacterium]
GRVFAVAISPDGSMVASAGDDRIIRLWNSRTGELIRSLEGHTGRIHSVAFSRDGSRVISGGGYQDHSVRVWNLVTGLQSSVLNGHSGAVDDVVFSADGQHVFSAGFDHRILIWDLTNQAMIAELGKSNAAARGAGASKRSIQFNDY